MSAKSSEVLVTLDSSLPKSPADLSAQAKAGGMIGLSWRAVSDASLKGYNLYRAKNLFSSAGQASKVNGSPLTLTSFDDLPSLDGTWYYAVSSVDRAGNESDLSNIISAISDRIPPRALSITYTPRGNFDPNTGRMAPGEVLLQVSLSEPSNVLPFLSITPHGGIPFAIDLTKVSDTQYNGSFIISDTTPSGTAYAVFSARDIVGNRGTEIDRGATIEIDTSGPSIRSLTIEPRSPIKNDSNSPVSVTVTLGLDEALKTGTLPDLSFLLSKPGRMSVPIGGILSILANPGDVQSFKGAFSLPSDAGLVEPENLSFIYGGMDDLENTGTKILSNNRFQVYQGELPPLEPPLGFAGKSLPGGKVRLTWSPTAGAAGYQLYRKAPGESAVSSYQRLPLSSEFIDDPPADGTYVYAISSIRVENADEAISAISQEIEVQADSIPPLPPSNLSLDLIARGINAVWSAYQSTEQITYSLYRENALEITSVSSLTAIIKEVSGTTVLDPNPSSTDHCYVVTALDRAGNESSPSNSFYLNFSLLPVSTLQVIEKEGSSPVLSWTHPGGGNGAAVSGYNVKLSSGAQEVKLNQGLVTGLSFTDTGFSGDERIYIVSAVDSNNVESPGRSITLPELSASLKEGEELLRGVMNRLDYVVENRSQSKVENIRLQVKAGTHLHTSESFSVDSGQSQAIGHRSPRFQHSFLFP